jgi:FixJ family two-component response regulator/anti-sigma regulatory factor (Ser/Thr protein kinase)
MNENNVTLAVIEDEDVIRENIQKKLLRLGYEVLSFDNAEDVLEIMTNDLNRINMVITDIKLPKMDGIELLRKIKLLDKPVPVLIITGHGNIKEAILALRLGASDFIRKPFDINDLASSVKTTLKIAQEKEIEDTFSQYADYKKVDYTIPVDLAIINPLAHKLVKDLTPADICSHGAAENISLALIEAISNAMFHGSLEVSSSLREEGGIKLFNEEIENRKKDPKYSQRKVFITHTQTKEYAEYIIEDEGIGFDYNNLPDPRDPENFFKNSGRGILIIKLHFDEVNWNEKGNKIVLRKNKEG